METNCTVFGMPAIYLGISESPRNYFMGDNTVKGIWRRKPIGKYPGYGNVLVWSAFSNDWISKTVRLDKIMVSS